MNARPAAASSAANVAALPATTTLYNCIRAPRAPSGESWAAVLLVRGSARSDIEPWSSNDEASRCDYASVTSGRNFV